MKYVIYPIFALILYLIIAIYIIWQTIHIFWHLKPYEYLMDQLFDECYYCLSHRTTFNTNWFDHERIFKIYVVPTSLLEYTKWVLKYGFKGEITELTKKEQDHYLEFCKSNKPK